MSGRKKKVSINQEIKEQFSSLACRLSPENLCGDGEYTPGQAKDLFKKIMAEWWRLEYKIGMKVTQEMVTQWEEEKVLKESL